MIFVGGRRSIFLLIFTFTNLLVYPDTVFQKRYTDKDGLSHNSIKCMAQDKQGFLWIGTFDGLCRFDGFEFKRYHCDPNDSASLPYSEITGLAVDKNNNLWIVGKILSRYDPVRDAFIRKFNFPSGKQSLNGNSSLVTDSTGTLYMLNYDRLAYYDPSSDSILEIPVFDENRKRIFLPYSIMEIDDHDNIWLFDEQNRIFKLSWIINGTARESKGLIIKNRYRFGSQRNLAPGITVDIRIYSSDDGTVFIGSNSGLYILDSISGIFRYMKGFTGDYRKLPGKKILWWSEKGKGLRIIEPKSGQLFTMHNSDLDFTQSVFQDSDQTLWIAGINATEQCTGLFQACFKNSGFTHLPDPALYHVKDLAVFSIFKYENDIWLGTKNFPYILSVGQDGNVGRIPAAKMKQWRPVIHPRAFIKDLTGTIWVGCLVKFLGRYDREKQLFKDVVLDPGQANTPDQNFPSFRFFELSEKGYILTGGLTSLRLFNPVTMKNIIYKDVPHDIYSSQTDDNAHFLLGGCGNLYVYDEHLALLKTFRVGGQDLFNIESICKENSTHYWLGLLLGGLCRLDMNTGQSEFFSTVNGLGNNTVYNILKDNQGNLWMSTGAGISTFNPKTRQFVNFDESNGLLIKEFNSDAAFQSADGQMIFGGMGGVVSFYPDQIEKKYGDFFSGLVITSIESFSGEKDSIHFPYKTDRVSFVPGTKNIQIGFSYIDYINQKKVSFRYSLKGLSDEWIVLKQGIRAINLMALRPGRFALVIEATDLGGNWSKSVSMEFNILPFFYETGWFRIGVILILLLIAVILILMRIRHYRLRQDQRLTQLRLITIQGQANPHFLSNSIAAAECFIASKDKEKANQYLGELRDMMRDLIDYTGKDFIPMEDEIKLLKRYLRAEQIRLDEKFRFQIETGDIDPDDFFIAPSMIQPFIENSIRYAFPETGAVNGVIRIWFKHEKEKNYMTCIIEDNGIGVKRSIQSKREGYRKSEGNEMIRKRLEIYNKLNRSSLKITTDEVNPGGEFPGTRIIIQIPVKFVD